MSVFMGSSTSFCLSLAWGKPPQPFLPSLPKYRVYCFSLLLALCFCWPHYILLRSFIHHSLTRDVHRALLFESGPRPKPMHTLTRRRGPAPHSCINLLNPHVDWLDHFSPAVVVAGRPGTQAGGPPLATSL
ncbi:hypothetical protein BCR44DRAFT_1067058 [Catenaria anguillulae PL171]|uniref:Uncharacterized protein n=1 Tax=Catenaria anguillulae PL171 TaxID=765915 RepID=A0A1Y2HPJ6_9FUNG|nr:hypothetical protein BCR44DRAFT_1067058 [Catenaria anguillulae PL171]